MTKAVTVDAVKTIMRPLADLKLISEAPAKLRDKYQVRKAANNLSMEELVASIRHNGVIFDLVVIEGKFVIAGNRRLTALRTIYNDAEFHVRTVDAESFGGDAREIALATNVGLPMHLVDRYEIIASLVADGFKPADIQADYAIDARQYGQVMKLAGLSPLIRNAWREGEISADAAQAFTLAQEMPQQEKLYKTLRKEFGDNHISRHAVKRRIIGDKSANVKKYLTFVGRELYEERGGIVFEDWFPDHDDATTVSNTQKLQDMVDEKIFGIIEQQKAAGWGWAMLQTPQQSRYHFETLPKPYSATKKASAGVFIDVEGDGSVKLYEGYIKPEDAKALKKASATKGSKASADATTTKEPAALSQAMRVDLTILLRQACHDALLASGKASKDELLESMAKMIAPQLTTNYSLQGKVPELLKLMPAKIVVEAIAKNFDAKDYFSRVARGFVEKAIKEAGFGDHLKDLKSKADCAKFAFANVTPTGWLPKELRTPHYAPTLKGKRK